MSQVDRLGNIEHWQERYEAGEALADMLSEATEQIVWLREEAEARGAEASSLSRQLRGAVDALREIAEPTVADPIHREYPSIQRLRKIAVEALDRLGGQ